MSLLLLAFDFCAGNFTGRVTGIHIPSCSFLSIEMVRVSDCVSSEHRYGHRLTGGYGNGHGYRNSNYTATDMNTGTRTRTLTRKLLLTMSRTLSESILCSLIHYREAIDSLLSARAKDPSIFREISANDLLEISVEAIEGGSEISVFVSVSEFVSVSVSSSLPMSVHVSVSLPRP